jgi:hypothetical protein
VLMKWHHAGFAGLHRSRFGREPHHVDALPVLDVDSA